MRFKDVFDRIQMHDLCSIFFFRSNCQLRLWNTVLLAGIFCKILWLQAKHSWLHNIHNFSLLSRQSVCIHLRFARISTICSVPRYIRRSHAIYDVQTKEIKPRNKQSTLIFCTGDTDELLLYTVWFCPCLVFLRGMTCA